MVSRFIETPPGRRIALSILAAAFVVIASGLIAYNSLVPASTVTLAVGEVAPADVLAPHSITYDSEVLTRQARQAASDAVHQVYDPPNPAVARQQLQLARQILDYINNIRHDSFATHQQQIDDILAIGALKITADMAERVLALPDDTWDNVDGQVMNVLERTMRDAIRDDNLETIYANLPNLVGARVDELSTSVITGLVRDLIKPNSFYNAESTHNAQDLAAQAVTAERRSFAQGQIVVRAGTIVSEADMEALTQLKLLQPADRRAQAFMGALLAVMLLGTLGVLYLRQLHTALFHDVPTMVLVGLLILVFLAGARIFVPASDFQAEIYPAAAFSLIVVSLTGSQVAIVLTSGLAVMIGLLAGGSLEYALLVASGGVAGVLSLNRTERINAYLRAGLVIAVANVTVGLLFLLIQGAADPLKVLMVSGTGVLNGIIAAGVAVAGLYLVTGVLNMPTNLRLIELSQPSQPLLQRLLREAPGTYQHSLQVANLAELAAERIGANAGLVRVAALYHDIGKMQYPHFFVENQVEGINPHDGLNDPDRSAQIIISHVTEGERMAHKYRLPSIFVDMILQHHGTTQVLYFYGRALKAVNCDESKIDKARFSYPGPRPQSREAAILMLADSSESVVRAKRPQTRQEIEDIINEIFDSRMSDNQLDESYLTINDLRVLREVFVTALQGVFHPRILYPELPTVLPILPTTLPAPQVAALQPPGQLTPKPENTPIAPSVGVPLLPTEPTSSLTL